MGGRRATGVNNSGKRSGKRDGGGSDATELMKNISIAAEHARASVMTAPITEITALEVMLEKDGAETSATAAILQALAAIKSDTMSKAWLAYFEVYQKYGMVPTAKIVEIGEPEDKKSDAEEYAEDTAGKAADEEEERQASDDLAKQRKKMVEEGKKKH